MMIYLFTCLNREFYMQTTMTCPKRKEKREERKSSLRGRRNTEEEEREVGGRGQGGEEGGGGRGQGGHPIFIMTLPPLNRDTAQSPAPSSPLRQLHCRRLLPLTTAEPSPSFSPTHRPSPDLHDASMPCPSSGCLDVDLPLPAVLPTPSPFDP